MNKNTINWLHIYSKKECINEVSIVGITGYSGLELVKILNNHKKVELVSIHATKEVGRRLSDVYPHLTDVCDLDIEVL